MLEMYGKWFRSRVCGWTINITDVVRIGQEDVNYYPPCVQYCAQSLEAQVWSVQEPRLTVIPLGSRQRPLLKQYSFDGQHIVNCPDVVFLQGKSLGEAEPSVK